MAVTESKLKTGKLLLGTAPGVDYACQPTNVRVVPEFNEEGDEVETLCGDTLTASATTSWSLQGTSIQDWDAPSGRVSLVQYSWLHNGETVPFVWNPNNGATAISGNVTVRALEVGGDVNTRITSDFDWPIAGQPVATWGASTPSTGATAGTPGSWTPAGSTAPSSVANLIAGTPNAVTASPTTAWTTGQYVQTGTSGVGGQAYWNGTAWTAGTAALAADDQAAEDDDQADEDEPDTGDDGPETGEITTYSLR
jgi:hypothetical protein